MHSAPDLIKQILASDRLPVLPDTALQLVELGNDPELYPAQLQAVLAGDPVVAARIMQVANSAMFARQSRISSLGQALAVLGVRLALGIATGVAVVESLREGPVASFDYEAHWRKSVLGAIAANELYDSLGVASRGELFLASLLQDIGSLALLCEIGDKYAQLHKATRNHRDLIEFERRAFGLDHAEIGAAMAEKWRLPDTIVRAISSSHVLLDGNGQGKGDDLDYGVAFSGMLAELWIEQGEDNELSRSAIKMYLERVGEERYQETVASILAAIPGANQLFNMCLLNEEQIQGIA